MVTREEVLQAVLACREQVARLKEIAPDTVPGVLSQLLSADDLGAKLDTQTEGKDEVRVQLIYRTIVLGISGMTEQLGRFEADLQRRVHPEGQPRIKRKFKQFKKRKGEW